MDSLKNKVAIVTGQVQVLVMRRQSYLLRKVLKLLLEREGNKNLISLFQK